MADYASLTRSRAAFLGQLKPIVKSIGEFEVGKTSVNAPDLWKASLDSISLKHQQKIDEMLECEESATDKISEYIESFNETYINALIAIEDCKDAQRVRRGQDMDDVNKAEAEAFFEQLEEAEAYKEQYNEASVGVGELRQRMIFLDSLQDKFMALITNIACHSDAESKTYAKNARIKFMRIFCPVSGWMTGEIERRAPATSHTGSGSKSKGSDEGDDSAVKVMLPQIELPKFDGSYEKWVPFRDSFKTLIHSQKKLSGSTKFRYLKTSITDTHSPISHLLETDDGYEDAWNSVMRYYDDERRILDGHFASMLTAKRMTMESHDELQKILNNFTLHTASIERMFNKATLYESLVAHLVIFRLDARTRDLWETHNKNAIPQWSNLSKFLQERRKTLSTMPAVKPAIVSKPGTSKIGWKGASNVLTAETKNDTSSNATGSSDNVPPSLKAPPSNWNSARTPSNFKCRLCNGEHKLHTCRELERLSVPNRLMKIREMKLCENCFSPSHTLDRCQSTFTCRQCRQKHHTLLHQGLSHSATPFQSNISCNTILSGNEITLLQTALVKIRGPHGEWQTARAFLDSGADSNFISTEVAKALKLNLQDTFVEANGLGGNRVAVIKHTASAKISNDEESEAEMELDFLVTPKVTNPTPIAAVDVISLNVPKNMHLADPHFNLPGKIDILLGNKVYGKMMRNGKYELTSGITLMNSMFGWVFTGSAPPHSGKQPITTICNHTTLGDLNNTIEKFYKIEDYKTEKSFLTDEQAFCEENFEQTHTRLPDGSFEVQIPFNKNVKFLEPNDQSTLCQFLNNEKRMQKTPLLSEKYGSVMREYKDLCHMSEIDVTKDLLDLVPFYLPHHGVVKEDSTTTQLRVVYDGSRKTSSGFSLNDAQCVGPNVQTDAFTLGIRFRQHPIAVKADVAKMYRQIKISKIHRHLQRLYWRDDPTEPIKIYELGRVTFGMASSAFLATRVLKQAGLDAKDEFPDAAREIVDNFYVDDWLSGEANPERAISLANDVVKVLDGAGMQLRKFSSNSKTFMNAIPVEHREPTGDGKALKALGLKWDVLKDVLGFDVKSIPQQKITKRTALSEISKIYDPDGMLGPVTFMFKDFMKRVHQLKTSWDAPLPKKEEDEWMDLAGTFQELGKIEIPRHFVIDSPVDVQLHGFSDSSDKGFGAVVYIVSRDAHGNKQSQIVCAKSRVSPTEYRSTARLELCGTVLLSNLMTRVEKALTIHVNKRFCWTDSAIVLHWLKKSPSQLQVYVANRVSEVQELSSGMTWRHIRTDSIPADLISRGMLPSDLLECKFWWNGPSFLMQHESQWPTPLLEINPDDPSYKNEFKKINSTINVAMTPENNTFLKMMENSSRTFFVKYKLAYVMRFIHNVRAKKLGKNLRSGSIQVDDLIDAENALIRICQQVHFRDDKRRLSDGKSLSSSSTIKNLSPFWDPEVKLIRVGGRLHQAQCSEEQKHPIILPNCHFTKLLIREAHERNLHPGQLATLNIVRMKFWPLRGRQIVKQQIHRCVKCFRVRPKMVEQFMGSLPAARITPSPPFYHTGVDYCGPFKIKVSSVRNAKTDVAYVALFICLSTKAIHLEVVSKLSTDAFFCAFDKFVSRRGLPRTMNSDHGLNFVGAKNEMKEFYEFLRQSKTQNELHRYFLEHEVEWKFIPPRAPEHGGLWEAGVKSMKHHFTRVAGYSLLTFEEFDQLKSKIEAILNSRPLTALSDDPNDFTALTAGHFLIGRPLISKPERNLMSESINRLQRWQRVTQIQQHFWQRWSQDYLHQLQVRTKNFKDKIPITEGQLVLLHVDNSPSLMWPIGRITKIYPGKDGVTRVASIRTAKSTYERPVTKLALLPIEDDDDQQVAGEC